MGSASLDGHSSRVELYLLVAGRSHPLSRVGPGTFSFREPQELPPATEAELIITIDGRKEVRSILLYAGSSSAAESVSYL